MRAAAGADTIWGGDGNNTLYGGDDNDVIDGGTDHDIVVKGHQMRNPDSVRWFAGTREMSGGDRNHGLSHSTPRGLSPWVKAYR